MYIYRPLVVEFRIALTLFLIQISIIFKIGSLTLFFYGCLVNVYDLWVTFVLCVGLTKL